MELNQINCLCSWPIVCSLFVFVCVFTSGLLIRPEHSETKAKTETRECETEIETETETKNYETETETETETSPVKSTAWESNTSRYVLFFYYAHEVNDEPEMDFAFKMISE